MISIEQQSKMLANISKELGKPITAYAVGGTAMMFLGFKEATLDIDLVFTNERERELFKEAIEKLGYREMNPVQVYGARKNQPIMLKLDDARFDLFKIKVIDFIFSESMQKRAEETHQFGDNLVLKIANPHDIILMKCATDRLKDKDDAIRIIKSAQINWSIIIEEARNQVKLGEERAIFELGCFLEDIKKIVGEMIPGKVMDELFELVQKQADNKK